jgi:hypothetical protein
MTRLLLGLLLAGEITAGAQNPKPAASISGRVTDADAGAPLADVSVGSRELGWYVTNADGRFTVSAPAGKHSLRIAGKFIAASPAAPREVTVESGQSLTGIDFRIRLYGDISGRVVDEGGEPVASARILAVRGAWDVAGGVGAAQVYANSELTLRASSATADSQGRYTIRQVQAGIPYRVLAYLPRRQVTATYGVAPPEPAARQPTLAATYHPTGATFEEAASVVVHSFGTRLGVDIRMRRMPSYCLDATTFHTTVSGPMSFNLEEAEVLRVLSPINVGRARVTGYSHPDGKLRVCDVYPGRFVLTAAPGFGLVAAESATLKRIDVPVVVKSADVDLFGVSPKAPVTVEAEVVWDNAIPPDSRLAMTVRTSPNTGNWTPIGNRFTLKLVAAVHYSVIVTGLYARHYVRDVTYAAGEGPEASIARSVLIPGEGGTTARLRIIVAPDGGMIAAQARREDGTPAASAMVLAWPDAATTDQAIAAQLVVGFTNEEGVFETGAMPPGAYRVLATSDPPPYWMHLPGDVPYLHKTPETLALLRRAHPNVPVVTVASYGTARVTLTPIRLESR